MDLLDQINEIKKTLSSISNQIETEEATKNALVMPFIQALGYNVFNPTEVIPEFTSDHGVKKGEKVDYVIKNNDKATILIECKKFGSQLNPKCASQLFRYFSVSDARISILTNGQEYLFFSDLDKPNQMDERPFFTINILDFESHEINELKKFTKNKFQLDNILETASDLKYTNAVKSILSSELQNPTDEFVRFFATQIYTGKLTQKVMQQFKEIVKKARKQFINEQINIRLQSALTSSEQENENQLEHETEEEQQIENEIITTQEELDAFNVVRAILRQKIPIKRIALRDTKSYCGVILDDNNRKPICRFHFNGKNLNLGLFDKKNETRVPIESIDDIFDYSEQLLKVIHDYD